MGREVLISTVAFFVFIPFCCAEQIRVIGWNVESDGNDPEVIADELAAFDGYDILGLSEVRKKNALKYVVAAANGENAFFHWLRGKTGGGDRLLIIWDSHKFDKVDQQELFQLQMGGGRAPLAVRLRSKSTNQEFWFMVNHLYRGNSGSNYGKRKAQAIGLRQWIQQQTIPVIVLGDFNFDYDIPSGPGNAAYNEMIKFGTAKWVKPASLIKTNSNPNYNSVLDFVFVNNAALAWDPVSTIIVRPNDFPDGSAKSDHRPVEAVFDTGASPTPPLAFNQPIGGVNTRGTRANTRGARRDRSGPSREQLLQQIKAMRTQLDQLEELVRSGQ